MPTLFVGLYKVLGVLMIELSRVHMKGPFKTEN
jgi:hypothetical protein